MATPDCLPVSSASNVGLAFGIVTAAGLSTAIGGALAFVMPKMKSETYLFLAGSLGVASGVMLFVSLVEIFALKTVESFQACLPEGKRDSLGYLYANLCFFAGLLLTYLFEVVLHRFEDWIVRKRDVVAEDAELAGAEEPDADRVDSNKEAHGEGEMIAEVYRMSKNDARALTRMGIFSGIALAFHNFPEGLATFVSVMDDPKVGISVAVAIAIHNIPEGICVAMPIYYATGSKWRAFMWATLSGITELIGAVLGFVVLRNLLSQTVYGVLFGIVAGMMVYISLKQLLPTAHKYDPQDKVTSTFLMLGILIMALSLVLFRL